MAKKKKSNKLLWGLLAITLVLIVVVYLSKGGFGKDEGVEVTIEKVEKRTIVETVEASGKIYPEIEVKISSDVSGEIVDMYVEEGDSVTAGVLLCRVKPDSYQSQVERAEAATNTAKAQLAGSRAQEEQTKAQILQTEATLANHKSIFERQKKLYEQEVISLAELETAETAYKTSMANLESMKANLESARQSIKAAEFSVMSANATVKEARTSLNQTTIYAPNSGIISMLNVEKGERVVGTLQMAGTEIMRIANMDNMEVRVEVSENDVLRVRIGDTTDIEVDAYTGRKFLGTVTEIASSASSAALAQLNTDQITNFVVKIRVLRSSYEDLISERSPFPFRPGMSATVEIRTNAVLNTISVPIQAVTVREDDKDKGLSAILEELVFVYASDSVKTRIVKTGIQDDTYIQVLEGLEEGEEIVSGPYSAVSKELEDGSLVKKKSGKSSKGNKEEDSEGS